MPVRYQRGSAGELHALEMPVEPSPELWVMRPSGRAVVMGSAQRADQFRHDRLERDLVDLAERRTGGGAVYLDPAAIVWIDVLAPRSSPWWHDDLSQTFLAVGRAWQRALARCGLISDLCTGPAGRSAAARDACWAGVGWGELTIGGRKIVGLSQRRTRWGARIQAMAVLDDSAARIADYLLEPAASIVAEALAPGPADRAALAVPGWPDPALRGRIEDAVLAELS